MHKKSRVILSPEAKEVYIYLNNKAPSSKAERMLLKAIKDKVELIKENRGYGNPIAKSLIPKEYRQKYGVTNLFRVELPCFWRMLYTLKGKSEIEIIAFVVDIMDHKKYNRKFGYSDK